MRLVRLAVTGRSGLPSSLDGDDGGKIPAARSREEVVEGRTIAHGATNHDSKKEEIRQLTGGQGGEEKEEEEQVDDGRDGDGQYHLTHGATVGRALSSRQGPGVRLNAENNACGVLEDTVCSTRANKRVDEQAACSKLFFRPIPANTPHVHFRRSSQQAPTTLFLLVV